MSAIIKSGLNGITAHAANAGIRRSIGESKKKNLSALEGMITSLSNNLMVSAID